MWKSNTHRACLLDQVIDGYLASVVPEATVPYDVKAIARGLARLMTYYESQDLLENANVLEMILERPPLTYRKWVETQLDASESRSKPS